VVPVVELLFDCELTEPLSGVVGVAGVAGVALGLFWSGAVVAGAGVAAVPLWLWSVELGVELMEPVELWLLVPVELVVPT
jgi:hypothetical protein